MPYQRIAILGLLLLLILKATAQQTYTIKVVDEATGTPVTGVYILMNNQSVGFTDESGVFRLTQPDADTLYLTHLIYEPERLLVRSLKKDTNYIRLKEKIYLLSEATVVAQKASIIARQAHKNFVAHYRKVNYWVECQYRQAIRYDKAYCNYLEYSGYACMPIPESNVFSGAPIQLPLKVRRTREDPVLQQFGYAGNHKRVILIAPTYTEYCSDYPYFEVIHPLNKWNYRNYRFSLDTTQTEKNGETVLVFRQKGNGFSTIGRWIHESTGKIWIDRTTGQVKRISCTFYKASHFNRIEVIYQNVGKDIFPESVEMELIENCISKNRTKELVFVESELKFGTPIPTLFTDFFRKNGPAINYRVQHTISESVYHPNDWKTDYSDNKWTRIIRQISHGEPEQEFMAGARIRIWDKTCYTYKYSTSEGPAKSKVLIEIMKKELNLKN